MDSDSDGPTTGPAQTVESTTTSPGPTGATSTSSGQNADTPSESAAAAAAAAAGDAEEETGTHGVAATGMATARGKRSIKKLKRLDD